jgi:hypothetical protein
MITVEVLVSIVILMTVVATSSSAIKYFRLLNDKKTFYEDVYINVLNIEAKIKNDICLKEYNLKGELNGYEYQAVCKKVKSVREYIKGFEDDEPSGNIGLNFAELFEINLQIKKERFEKDYTYYKYFYRKNS